MANTNGSDTLGRVSLGLGIASAALVFGIGICAVTGFQGGWLGGPLATVLFICGASSAFLGFLGLLTGLGGLLTSRGRLVAGLGAGISAVGMCLFAFILSRFGG